MGLFDFLSPNKKAAKIGCDWAIEEFERVKKSREFITDEEIFNHLFEKRFRRESLSDQQQLRYEKYAGKLGHLFDLIVATGDVESNIYQDPNAFDEAARAVYDELSKRRYVSAAFQTYVDSFLRIS